VARSHLALGHDELAVKALKKYRGLEPQNEWAAAELNRVRLEILKGKLASAAPSRA
jgi:predicted RecB family nuclease